MSQVHYSQCPVCAGRNIRFSLQVKDHSVTGETFEVWQCADCTLRFTQDAPSQDSIGKYYQSQDYISHTNTSKGAINRLYQRVRKFTLDGKASLIEKYTRPAGTLLDVGAGTGAFLNTMKNRGWQVTGIEPDEGARKQANAVFGVELQDASVFSQLPPGKFDAITLWHVLEHVHDLQGYMHSLKKLVTPQGRIFIAVPNYTAVDASVYGQHWAAYDVPRHLYHFTPVSIEVLLERTGLQLITKKPMWFDSFYISLLSSKYKNGKTSWIGAGLTGLQSNIKALANSDRCSSVIYVVGKGS